MPNHITTICTLSGPIAAVAAFVERHIVPARCDQHEDCEANPALAAACYARENETNRRWFDFDTITPMPKVLKGTISPDREHAQNRLAEKETGFSNWYDWAIANWGTKWGAYDFEEREHEDGHYVFKFETAWSFPEKPFRKLAEMHPSVVFDIASLDDGGNFGCLGQFNGANNYRCERALGSDDDLYKRVYGHERERDEDEESDEVSADSKGGDRG